MNPRLRCFADLASWLDSHAAELAGRKVLMYCTGGVRCERASAYLRSKGSAFQDVVQLHGEMTACLCGHASLHHRCDFQSLLLQCKDMPRMSCTHAAQQHINKSCATTHPS